MQVQLTGACERYTGSDIQDWYICSITFRHNGRDVRASGYGKNHAEAIADAFRDIEVIINL